MDEQSHLPTFMSTVLTVIIAVIVVAAVFVPLIDDFKKTAGDPITFNNAEISGFDEYGQYYTEDITMVVHSPEDATTVLDTIVTVNGEQIHLRTPTWNQHEILVSDNVAILINTSTSSGIMAYMLYNEGLQSISIPIRTDITVEYDSTEKIITVEYTDSADNQDKTIVTNATSVFAVSNNHEYVYLNAASQFPSMYISEEEMKNNTGGVIYSYSASITTGTETLAIGAVSDRLGTRIVGVVGATQEYTYKSSIEFRGLTLANGTTDVYTGGQPVFILTVSDGVNEYTGEFVPSRSFIISEVTGHTDSGILYTLYGILPVFMLLGVLLVIVNSFVNFRGGRESYSSGDDYDNF